MDVQVIVKALLLLESRTKESPSVEDVADEAGCSVSTAHKYLKQAVEKGLITQTPKGKFMSKQVAAAYERQSKKFRPDAPGAGENG